MKTLIAVTAGLLGAILGAWISSLLEHALPWMAGSSVCLAGLLSGIVMRFQLPDGRGVVAATATALVCLVGITLFTIGANSLWADKETLGSPLPYGEEFREPGLNPDPEPNQLSEEVAVVGDDIEVVSRSPSGPSMDLDRSEQDQPKRVKKRPGTLESAWPMVSCAIAFALNLRGIGRQPSPVDDLGDQANEANGEDIDLTEN
ncbi:MAG: hypothetical protein AAFX06_16725 [Planctomycetota bacterium]